MMHLWRCHQCGLLYSLLPPSAFRAGEPRCVVCLLFLQWIGTREVK